MGDALNRRIELHTCRQQHVVLRHLLGEFPTNEPFSGDQILLLLERLNTVLVRHVRLEDECLYPALVRAQDENVRNTAQAYQVEMGPFIRAFAEFENRWHDAAAIDADPSGFLDHWTAVRRALEERMDAEDRALYLEAEEHFTRMLTRTERD